MLHLVCESAADTWLEAREDLGSERRHLLALQEDIEESLEVIALTDRRRERMVHSLASIAESDLSEVEPDSLSRWTMSGLFETYGVASKLLRLTALTDLKSSNQLSLLSAPLRREIAELDQRIAVMEQAELDLTATQQALMDPYLVEHLPLSSLLAREGNFPLSATAYEIDLLALQEGRLLNAIAFKISMERGAARFRRQVGEQMETLLELVSTRLNELGG